MTMSTPDLSSIISGVLSNPEMLSGIMNAVSALGSSGIGSILQNTPKSNNDPPPTDSSRADRPAEPPQSSVLEAFAHRGSDAEGGISSKDLPPSPLGNSSKERRALLYALKPFLGEKRGEKIDFILKVLALLDTAESFNKFKQ